VTRRKLAKWSPEEDVKIIQLRRDGMKWEDIGKHFPGRSAISCKLRDQNYLERRFKFDEDGKNKLARLYERYG
jgi:Myb-like DNA-binding domain